jgi:plastocyanin
MRFRPPRLVLAALLLVPFLGACGGSDSAPPAAAGHVNVTDNTFTPKVIEIAPGDTVTWDFKGNAQHNAKGEGGIDSGNMKEGSYEKQFNSAGTYSYVCTIHPGMTGKVKVG